MVTITTSCSYMHLQGFAGRLRDCAEMKVTYASIIGHNTVHFCGLEISNNIMYKLWLSTTTVVPQPTCKSLYCVAIIIMTMQCGPTLQIANNLKLWSNVG